VSQPGIRAAEPDELRQLAAIEAAADRLFDQLGFDLIPGPGLVDRLAVARCLLVAGRPAVGFARLEEVDGRAHLEQLAVDPAHGRRGIGGSLLEAAVGWAAAQGYREMTLVTFADVAWNAPFYAGRGFEPLDDLGPELAEIRALERSNGLDRLGRRVVMVRSLRPAGDGGSIGSGGP
jgi:GNAT superfamily N-acetyltransferase